MSSIRVGFCLNERKMKKLNIKRLIPEFSKLNIHSSMIDMMKDLEEQGPFDVIIHKVLGMKNSQTKDRVSAVDMLKQYCKSHKDDVTLLDPIDLSEKIGDRLEMTNILKKCEFSMNGITVFVPKSILITEDMSLEGIKKTLQEQQIQFPILAKPKGVVPIGSDLEVISIIFSEEQLCDIPKPSIIQEFHNHGGVMYKIYVIGEKYRICQRPSIKNLDCCSQTSICFSTKDISKTGVPCHPELHDCDPSSSVWLTSVSDILNPDVINELVKRLRATTGVSLAGLDLILVERTGDYGIIDLNYFPGYDGVNEHFVEDLSLFLKSLQPR